MSESILIFLIGNAVAMIIGMVGIYMKISLKLKELEIRITVVEKQDDSMLKKLDMMMEKINEILLELENKQNRH